MIRSHDALSLTRRFLTAPERKVIQTFASLPGAVLLHVPNELPGVFVPGSLPVERRACLVAHTDTVWDDAPIGLNRHGYRFTSSNAKLGIGADDRAGCAALWALRRLGHSLLVVPGEERGCIGSRAVSKRYPDLLTEHALAIQFDRRGSSDLVFYDGEPEPLLSMLGPYFPGYSEEMGSFSDVSVLCPAYGIAGCNISIGFDHEHTASESLDVRAWMRTVDNARSFLRGPALPKTPYEESYSSYSGWAWGYGPTATDDPNDVWDDDDEDGSLSYWCSDCAYDFWPIEIDERDADDVPLCPVCRCGLIPLEVCPND